MYPSWSPDGTQIAFTADEAGNDDIYVMNSDGSDLRRLTDNDIAVSGSDLVTQRQADRL